jgi:integrase
LLSGARYGELCRLSVQDFDSKAGTLHIRMSKSGKGRHVFLTDAGVTFFDSLAAGRAGDAAMFTNASGEPWIRGSQNYPQRRACLHAKLKPFGFHILRHTYGAQCVMGGMPLQVLAQNLGHSTTRMTEKHYAHLTSNFVRDTVRQFAPSFGIQPDEGNVVPLVPKPALAGRPS